MESNDTIRARQTEEMLRMAGQMVDLMQDGLSQQVAQAICDMLLPNSAAIAVAITDRTVILGYAGYRERENPAGAPIRTQATHDTVADGETRVIYTANDIGFPSGATRIQAAIVVPLVVGREARREIRGTLKFYYASADDITETQKSIAQGFAKLLSTQIAAAELERQRELATSMELKMLQSQINPHFLFNTINTIASFIRTDPPKARELLREFAVFYRSTLEDSQDRIPLERELRQTARYFMFEVARFGEERLELVIDVEELPKGRRRKATNGKSVACAASAGNGGRASLDGRAAQEGQAGQADHAAQEGHSAQDGQVPQAAQAGHTAQATQVGQAAQVAQAAYAAQTEQAGHTAQKGQTTQVEGANADPVEVDSTVAAHTSAEKRSEGSAASALEALEDMADLPAEEGVMVPPFLLQPLVENAVKHAMPSEGKLTVTLRVRFEVPDVLMQVRDDGVGMPPEECDRIMHPESQTGLGIAVKNVHDRLHGFFGPAASMTVESEPGNGTVITLRLPDII